MDPADLLRLVEIHPIDEDDDLASAFTVTITETFAAKYCSIKHEVWPLGNGEGPNLLSELAAHSISVLDAVKLAFVYELVDQLSAAEALRRFNRLEKALQDIRQRLADALADASDEPMNATTRHMVAACRPQIESACVSLESARDNAAREILSVPPLTSLAPARTGNPRNRGLEAALGSINGDERWKSDRAVAAAIMYCRVDRDRWGECETIESIKQDIYQKRHSLKTAKRS